MGIILKSVFHFVAVVLFLCLSMLTDRTQAAEQSGHLTVYPGKLFITGSSTMCPLIAEIGKRFQTLHPEVRFEIQCGGSGRGISDALNGKADIGMVSRTLTDKEKNLYSFPIARDGVSIILHKSNPVKSLSDAQIADIYTGKITNWKKVGGRDAPITVINAKKGYSSAELFVHYFKVDYEDIKTAIVAGDNPTRITAVAGNPNAIAYVSSGEAERKAASGAPIKLLPIHNVMPTNRNIITGNYPIARPLTLVINKLPSGMVKAFIEFYLSSAVVDIIERYDFVPYED
jgi:phosphate transport system substrate-binding protein